MRKQSGFTLIEIAIVLVIIGLLLGGILKGQELINSAKVKSLAQDFRNIPIYIYGYQDKYKALPGDQIQAKLDAQFPPANTAAACTPTGVANKCVQDNGIIDGTWQASTVADESYVFWQHIRLAGLAPGSTDTTSAAYRPQNSEGGVIGVQSGVQAPIAAIRGTFVICSGAILGKFVRQLDLTLDDGDTAKGSMMATAFTGYTMGAAATATSAIVDADSYIVCMGV